LCQELPPIDDHPQQTSETWTSPKATQSLDGRVEGRLSGEHLDPFIERLDAVLDIG
jgi:hypothetical protein